MAVLPPVAQIAGPHIGIYETLFKQADSQGNGAIPAVEAAAFLKTSGLPETTLSKVNKPGFVSWLLTGQSEAMTKSRFDTAVAVGAAPKGDVPTETTGSAKVYAIWELSDSQNHGYLDQESFFVALKLISLAQASQEVSLANLLTQSGPPSMGTAANPAMVGISDNWTISATERVKYDQIFDGLGPQNGILSGDKVKPVLVNSKLPVDVLSRVWDLSDIDGDGFLDREEFAVAMHLVYKALEKEPVPMKLPPGLMPPGKQRKGSVIVGGVPVLPALVSAGGPGSGRSSPAMSSPARKGSITIPSGTSWVVTPAEQQKYDEIFRQNDLDKDGFLSGGEIKGIFLQSGVPQAVLAHIWNLCDMKGIGKLNPEQFSLAMYLIQNKLKGIEPPPTLAPEMVPPSARTGASFPFPDMGGGGAAGAGFSEASSMELDMITKEIEELKREKMQLEQDKAQRAADIRIRNGEVAGLQKELDAINSTLKQLETQKGEAQKKLDELDVKKGKLDSTVEGLKEKCDEEEKQIANLKSMISNQEAYMKNQEEELKQKRDELNELRQEEVEMEQKVDTARKQADQLAKSLNDTISQISQTKQRIQDLQDSQVTLETHINQYNALLNGQDGAVEPAPFTLNSTSSRRGTIGSSPPSTISSVSGGEDSDPFKGRDPFGSTSGVEASDPFGGSDPFKDAQPDDPFKGTDPFKNDSFGGDPFGGDPFSGGFGGSSRKDSAGFGASNNDPFGGSNDFDSAFSNRKESIPKDIDPFDAAFNSSKRGTGTSAQNDPFAPAGGVIDLKSPNLPPGADPFGADPFVMSPGKVLGKKSQAPPAPSKMKKAPPPPRPPAPKKSPRPSPIPSDPFGGTDPFAGSGENGNNGDNFANFAEFSPSKFGSNSAFGESTGSAFGGTDSGFSAPASGFGQTDSAFTTSPPKDTAFHGPESEAAQLAWATRQSQEAEWERQKRLKEQEESDLKLALELSQQDAVGSSDA